MEQETTKEWKEQNKAKWDKYFDELYNMRNNERSGPIIKAILCEISEKIKNNIALANDEKWVLGKYPNTFKELNLIS